MIKILCLGKIKETFFKEAINEYTKRLSKYTKIDIVELDDYKVNPGIADLKFEYDPPAHANTVNNFISNQGD